MFVTTGALGVNKDGGFSQRTVCLFSLLQELFDEPSEYIGCQEGWLLHAQYNQSV